MTSWPNCRSRMPPRAVSASAATRPKTLRFSRGFPSRARVGRAEVEEAEGVGLHDLPEVHQAPEFLGSGGDVHGQEGVARLGRGEEVADRTDAADARGDARHFGEGPAFAELLEAAELDHVEARVGHVAIVIELERDLGVPLDAGHGLDFDPFRHAKGWEVRSSKFEV